jgi:hypothetical protein
MEMSHMNNMIQQPARPADYDPAIQITDYALVEKLGESALIGAWFAFLKADWLARSGFERLLTQTGISQPSNLLPRPVILFRGKEELALPGATISPTSLPAARLVSLTSDKALYRAHHDTVHLLIAAPQRPGAAIRLHLRLGNSNYNDYRLTLDEYGLCLCSLSDLPEGTYEATLGETEDSNNAGNADDTNNTVDFPCRFEVAEYRLAPLNAELIEQQLSGEKSDSLRYTLAVSAFGQPYHGPIEVELQERGRRVGRREKLTCDHNGHCRGVAKLAGAGPYTLNLFAGEQTATVALKGSEQQRRETLVISELGTIHSISLLPAPQSDTCRGMYVTNEGGNDEPLALQAITGSEAVITPRESVEQLKAVVIDPLRGSSQEYEWTQLVADQEIKLPVPAPYGLVLLGAFIDGYAWEGWCAILRPSELQLRCEAPAEAQPGKRIAITLSTNQPDRIVPIHLVIKDQRLIAPSDPQTELASCIKSNLAAWHGHSRTGRVERSLSDFRHVYRPMGMMRAMAMPLSAPMAAPMTTTTAMPPVPSMPMPTAPPTGQPMLVTQGNAVFMERGSLQSAAQAASAQPLTAAPTLAQMRVAFTEVVYNAIVHVQGETTVQVKLGDGLTRYSVETFALSTETMDWQRAETTIEAVQPVYGELTVSPFVAAGDPVLGRLDVGAAAGSALVEVRLDDEPLPLFDEAGKQITPGQPVSSGSVLRFPVRPGTITSIVRDARQGNVDVSERYVTEPGRLRHITRRLQLLTPGEQIALESPPMLELKPLPGLEQPFQFFLEGAIYYPFGCIEQTSMKLFAMFAGYIVNADKPEIASTYAAAIPAWHKRLRSMALANGGFCMYPPGEGGTNKVDTHYAPRGVQHLLHLPSPVQSGIREQALLDILNDISLLAKRAAAYYKITFPSAKVSSCHDAYIIMRHSDSQERRDEALSYARGRLREERGKVYVRLPDDEQAHNLYGVAVAERQETAYAAATLLAGAQSSDLPRAIAATNYLTSQVNDEGRLYSTVDTAACLSLLLELRDADIVTTADGGLVEINGQQMSLANALAYTEKVETLRCIEGVIAAQITSEISEDWNTVKSVLSVQVSLERDGRARDVFHAGDALDLVIRVPRYEPGMIAHVCLPDALARVVGGGQVKRFSADFCEQNTLRIPLAAISATSLPRQLRGPSREASLPKSSADTQHWAVIVRNMYKEEQIGNPGRLEVRVKE